MEVEAIGAAGVCLCFSKQVPRPEHKLLQETSEEPVGLSVFALEDHLSQQWPDVLTLRKI